MEGVKDERLSDLAKVLPAKICLIEFFFLHPAEGQCHTEHISVM